MQARTLGNDGFAPSSGDQGDEVTKKKKSYWNYRVVRTTLAGEEFFAIHEVYYTDDVPTSITEEAVEPSGSTHEALLDDLRRMQEACQKPTLNFEDFR